MPPEVVDDVVRLAERAVPGLAAANQAAEVEVLRWLRDGTLTEGFPAVVDPVVLGIGQSMGGCMTIIQQGRYECYDGIGILGYSAVHTHPPTPPAHRPRLACGGRRCACPRRDG